ncbi:MAG: hypothetical protein HOP19_01795 [Acidobacteria bacterium]|nr:hypothetical protein [Acidobacteriota bacterium]
MTLRIDLFPQANPENLEFEIDLFGMLIDEGNLQQAYGSDKPFIALKGS